VLTLSLFAKILDLIDFLKLIYLHIASFISSDKYTFYNMARLKRVNNRFWEIKLRKCVTFIKFYLSKLFPEFDIGGKGLLKPRPMLCK